jgi:trans-aconitate methyltransferase
VALDVGCGAGCCPDLLARHGFGTDGIDVSPAMIALARDRHPETRLSHADICRWELSVEVEESLPLHRVPRAHDRHRAV